MSEIVMRKFGGRPRKCTKQLVGIDGQPAAYKYTPEPPGKFKIILDVPSVGLAKDYFDSEYGVHIYDAIRLSSFINLQPR